MASAKGTAKLERSITWTIRKDAELKGSCCSNLAMLMAVKVPTIIIATASPTPNQPRLRCRWTLWERISADCTMKNTIHAGNTMAWIYRTKGGSGERWMRLWSMVWLKPYTAVAAISSDMKK